MDERAAAAERELGAAAVLAAVSIGVLVIDGGGVVRYANPETTRLLGWTADQLVGVPVDDTLHPHHRMRAPAVACTLVAPSGGAATSDESDVFLRHDGSLLPVSWVADPLPRPDGGPADVVVTFADVTERQLRSVTEAAAWERDRADLWSAQQSVSDLGWIAELTRVMSSTMDEDEALGRLARLLTPRLADVAIVDRVDEAAGLVRVGWSAASELGLDLDSILARPDVQPGPHDSATRLTTNSPAVTRLAAAQMFDPAVLSAPSRRLLAEIGARSLLIVPLAARNRMVGIAGLIRAGTAPFSDDDMLLAADVGRRTGLVLDNARLYREQRRTAEALQLALLPAVRDTDHLRVAARYLPAADRLRVGGDWYDLFDCPGEDAAHILVVGDVAGHDLRAGTGMAAIRNLLRGIAVTRATGPSGLLDAVDAALPALDIAGTATTLLVRAVRQPGGWELTWSNAGHPPALLLDPDGGPARLLDARPDVLLGTRFPTRRREHTLTVPAGTTLLLYTDGLIERRDEDLDRGLSRLRQAAAGPADRTPGEIADDVLARMSPTLEDDIAVLVARLD